MKTTEKAMIWWNGLWLDHQIELTNKHLKGTGIKSGRPTDEQIKQIYLAERTESVMNTFDPVDWDE